MKQTTSSNIQIEGHSAIIANKSAVMSKLLSENKPVESAGKPKMIVIDFKGQFLYQAFKKVLDFCYLEDMNIFNTI